jgi:hypothetical protein
VSASLDFPAITESRSAVRPLIRQVFPSSPIPVATSLELLDGVTGAITAVAYPMPLRTVSGVKRPTFGARGQYVSGPVGH